MPDLKEFVGRRILVFVDDLTIAGTLVRVLRNTVQIENATEVETQRQIDGVAVIPVTRIDWIQVP